MDASSKSLGRGKAGAVAAGRIALPSVRRPGTPDRTLLLTKLSGDLVMEPGPVELSAGSSSSDIRSSATITVTGQTRVITGEERAFLSPAIIS
jgi:hypothetical protein